MGYTLLLFTSMVERWEFCTTRLQNSLKGSSGHSLSDSVNKIQFEVLITYTLKMNKGWVLQIILPSKLTFKTTDICHCELSRSKWHRTLAVFYTNVLALTKCTNKGNGLFSIILPVRSKWKSGLSPPNFKNFPYTVIPSWLQCVRNILFFKK